jgi:hypothetical protein
MVYDGSVLGGQLLPCSSLKRGYCVVFYGPPTMFLGTLFDTLWCSPRSPPAYECQCPVSFHCSLETGTGTESTPTFHLLWLRQHGFDLYQVLYLYSRLSYLVSSPAERFVACPLSDPLPSLPLEQAEGKFFVNCSLSLSSLW